jgi:hypothetical protein
MYLQSKLISCDKAFNLYSALNQFGRKWVVLLKRKDDFFIRSSAYVVILGLGAHKTTTKIV